MNWDLAQRSAVTSAGRCISYSALGVPADGGGGPGSMGPRWVGAARTRGSEYVTPRRVTVRLGIVTTGGHTGAGAGAGAAAAAGSSSSAEGA